MLSKGLLFAAVAAAVVGGSAIAFGAHEVGQDTDADEVAAVDEASPTDESTASADADGDQGIEAYRAHGHGRHGHRGHRRGRHGHRRRF